MSLTRYTSGSFNCNRHNRNRRIGLYESPCLEVMNLVLVSLSPRILNRQHAHKQTKELGHDGNGQSTFSGSSRDGRLVHHNYLVFYLVKSVIEVKARSVKSMKSRGMDRDRPLLLKIDILPIGSLFQSPIVFSTSATLVEVSKAGACGLSSEVKGSRIVWKWYPSFEIRIYYIISD